MRVKLANCLVGLCVLAPGCHLVGNATHNVLSEIHQSAEDHSEHRRNRLLARQAWDEFRSAHAEKPYSEDFADGFQEGLADYVYAGGDGEPPALPPHRYWKTSYQTPQGFQAMEDWFAGFRQGAAVAEQNGYRRFVTLPSSLAAPAAAMEVHPAAAMVPVPEKAEPCLPAPKAVTRAPAHAEPSAATAERSQPTAQALKVATAAPGGPDPVPHVRVLGLTAAARPAESSPKARVVGLVATPRRLTLPDRN